MVLSFLLVLAWSLPPYVVAALHPPPDKTFIGVFYHAQDFYNYLSYAQQAEQGAFLLQNKVLLAPHPPALVNLEWWLVGRMSALFGGNQLLLAYRAFAVAVAFGFLWVADRWLRRLGMDGAHRLPALVLVSTGGGLGGLLFALTDRSIKQCLDINAGLFPFLGLLANPHFVAGTTLLLLGLLLFDREAGPWGAALAIAVGSILALVRPYDFALLVLIRAAAVLALDHPRQWPRRLWPLLGLLPACAYLYWLFYRNPAFSFYAKAHYAFPPRLDLAWALGPALLLMAFTFRRSAVDGLARRARVHLLAWAAFGLAVVVFAPVPFSLQFLVGIGFPLLALGAHGLATRPAVATVVLAFVFSTSLAVALRYVLGASRLWYTPSERMKVVRALQATCEPDDVVVAPPAIGILAYGLTNCRPFVSHRIAPDYAVRLDKLRRFANASARKRSSLLDEYGIRRLVLPGDAGPVPVAWLGPDTPFMREQVVRGTSIWSIYVRFAPSRQAEAR